MVNKALSPSVKMTIAEQVVTNPTEYYILHWIDNISRPSQELTDRSS